MAFNLLRRRRGGGGRINQDDRDLLIAQEVDRISRLAFWFIEFTEFNWFPFKEWPQWAQEASLKAHKNNSERYNLFTFFVFNGATISLAIRFIESRDARQDQADGRWVNLRERYDENAIRQMYKQMPQQLKDGTLARPEKRVYDLVLGRPIRFDQGDLDHVNPNPVRDIVIFPED